MINLFVFLFGIVVVPIENCFNLKTLVLRDCYFVDNWCVAELSHMFADQLENLDLSGCHLVSDSGLWPLGYLK